MMPGHRSRRVKPAERRRKIQFANSPLKYSVKIVSKKNPIKISRKPALISSSEMLTASASPRKTLPKNRHPRCAMLNKSATDGQGLVVRPFKSFAAISF